MVGAVVVVVAAGVVAGLVALTGNTEGDGAGAPAGPIVDPPRVAAAASYRVAYRVDDTAGLEPLIATDVIDVRQPFDFRLEHREGAPPGGEVSSSTVLNHRFEFNFVRGAEAFVTDRVAGPLVQTFSVEALEAGVEAGTAERLGQETMLSELCVVYRYRRSGNDPLAKGDGQERVEACVTPDGVLLREQTVVGGRRVRVAEAVEVNRNPSFSSETFLDRRNPAEETGARYLQTEQPVAEGKNDDSRISLAAPKGFTVARQATVTRQPGPGAAPVAVFVRSFTRGTELVVIEEQLSPRAAPPWGGDEGQPVELGQNRKGRVVHRPSYSEVRVTASGTFVKITSPRPALALAVARTVRG